MGTARMIKDKETEEQGKKGGLRMDISKAATKEKMSPDGIHSLPYQIHIEYPIIL